MERAGEFGGDLQDLRHGFVREGMIECTIQGLWMDCGGPAAPGREAGHSQYATAGCQSNIAVSTKAPSSHFSRAHFFHTAGSLSILMNTLPTTDRAWNLCCLPVDYCETAGCGVADGQGKGDSIGVRADDGLGVTITGLGAEGPSFSRFSQGWQDQVPRNRGTRTDSPPTRPFS
jgi:hypothetical protein